MKKALMTAATLVAISPIASAQTSAPVDPLATRAGWEIGVQVSDYSYKEPSLDVKIWGNRAGITGAYTYAGIDDWFVKVDARYSYGSLEYEGSGTSDSVPDSILEARGVVSRDFRPRGGVSLSPYAGIGYRYLYNDLRGRSSTGAIGYRRYSNYLYVPLGLTARFHVGGQWAIAPTAEYDYFIEGKQVSKLTDTELGFDDATNKQDKGYGYRLSIMAENGSWAFGPWMHFWSIDDSDIVPIGFGFGGQEPKNETREYGLEVKYRF